MREDGYIKFGTHRICQAVMGIGQIRFYGKYILITICIMKLCLNCKSNNFVLKNTEYCDTCKPIAMLREEYNSELDYDVFTRVNQKFAKIHMLYESDEIDIKIDGLLELMYDEALTQEINYEPYIFRIILRGFFEDSNFRHNAYLNKLK